MKTITYSVILVAALSSFSLAQPSNYSHLSMEHSSPMQHSSPMGHSSMDMPHNTDNLATSIMAAMHQPMMENSPVKSGNPNKDFLANMLPHHQGAILASKAVLKVPNLDPRVRKIAKNIIQSQEKEIILFKSLLNNKDFPETSDKIAYENFYNESQNAMDSMMNTMSKIHENDPQRAFLAGMIPHHQGAVVVSEQILRTTKDSDIIKIARDIIKEQKREIATMQKLLKGME